MTVSHVEILVEEQSMEVALRGLLEKIVGHRFTYEFRVFSGKYDLLAKLPSRLKGYAHWLPQDWRIIVVIDRDEEDCRELKHRLDLVSSKAGLLVRSRPSGHAYQVVNRLAIEELEAWYFGDWDAVRTAYPKVPARVPDRRGFRDPDSIQGGTWQAFERILQSVGYFRTGLRKIEAAREIAKHWRPNDNRSRSFQALRDVILEMSPPER